MSPRDLFLVRHGEAVEAAVGGDPARPLTPRGRAAIASVGRALKIFGVAPDAVWHSPYVRATETARLLGEALSTTRLIVEDALVPASSEERALDALRAASDGTLIVVSHMPLLPALASALVGAHLNFGTGTVAHIALFGPRGATLLGLWTAEKLARVG